MESQLVFDDSSYMCPLFRRILFELFGSSNLGLSPRTCIRVVRLIVEKLLHRNFSDFIRRRFRTPELQTSEVPIRMLPVPSHIIVNDNSYCGTVADWQ